MFNKKNLAAKLSLPLFVALIISFTMLQGFDTADNQSNYSLMVIVTGPNSANCTVKATRVGGSTQYTLTYSNGAYYYYRALTSGDYVVKACVNGSPTGDGASIIMKVVIDPGTDNIATISHFVAQTCLE